MDGAGGTLSVVVTGGAGYVGSHIALEPIAAGREPGWAPERGLDVVRALARGVG